MSATRTLKKVRDHGVKLVMRTAYNCIKPFARLNPDKVLFLSRHSNSETLDFRLLREELMRQNPHVKVVTVAHRFEGRITEIPGFARAMIRSLFHLANSKVCVLDSYWPGVSVLDHNPELKVYQMWHSLGKVKRTGKQAIGRKQGRAADLANILKMHEGYDYVVAGGEFWNRHYRETFGVNEDQVLHIGLPRADYLVNEREEIAERIYAKYPELKEKPVMLYVPTFRRKRQRTVGARNLSLWTNRDRFTLVVKKHKDDELEIPSNRPVLTCPEFSGFEMLAVADYVVTDYSSIALEAALIDVPTYYYVYDYDDYRRGNGMNIDLFKEMPECVFLRAQDLGKAMAGPYPVEALQRYKEKYLFADPGHSAGDLASHILNEGGLCSR